MMTTTTASTTPRYFDRRLVAVGWSMVAIFAPHVRAFIIAAPSSRAAAAAAGRIQRGINMRDGRSTSRRSLSNGNPKKHQDNKRRSGSSGSSIIPVVFLVGGHPAAMDDAAEGSSTNGSGADGNPNTVGTTYGQTSSSSGLKKKAMFKSVWLAMTVVRKWLLKRWAIIFAAFLLGGFVQYGSAGSLKLLPFIPAMKKKAESLSDWSILAAVYGVAATFIAGIVAFNMADTAIDVAAKNRKEDQAREDQSKEEDDSNRKEDQAREDRFREEDDSNRKEDQAREDRFREEDNSNRKEDQAREDRFREVDHRFREEERLDRRVERLENTIVALRRERRQPLLLPWDRQVIDEDIKIATRRLENLRDKYDSVQLY